MRTCQAAYSGGSSYLDRLDLIDKSLAGELSTAERKRDLLSCERVETLVRQFDQLQSEALLANPDLDFDRLLLIRRVPHGDPRRPQGTGYGVAEYIGLPRQSSKCNPNIERPFDWDNEIAVLSPVRPDGQSDHDLSIPGRRLITDIDLHWDADRCCFPCPAVTTNGTSLKSSRMDLIFAN